MEKKLAKLFTLFVFLLFVSTLLMSCTKKAEQTQTQENLQKSEEIKTETKEQENVNKETQETKIETNKTKSAVEETQETLVSLLNGVYSVEKEYMQPKGKDLVSIEVELKDNIIQDIQVKPIKIQEDSKKYINNVNNKLQDLVVGKDIREINLPDKISGSSLTTPVVKEYLDELKAKAA